MTAVAGARYQYDSFVSMASPIDSPRPIIAPHPRVLYHLTAKYIAVNASVTARQSLFTLPARIMKVGWKAMRANGT